MFKKPKKLLSLCMTLLLCASALAGCAQNNEGETASVTELSFCESWDFAGGFYPAMTPEVSTNYSALYFAPNFYETLVNYESGEFTPGLATSWQVSDDGKVYTFKLREGVKFSDGEDFNAEAAKRSLEVVPQNLGQYNGSYGSLSALFAEIKAVDTYTLEIHLIQPYYGTLKDLTMMDPMAIVSPAALGEDGKPKEDFKSATFGTGAYMYAGDGDGAQYTFVINPYYHGEKPQIEKFIVKVIPDNDAKLLALKNGEIDVIVGADKVSFDGFNEMKSSSGFAAITSSEVMNTRSMFFNSTKAPFDDPAIRRAVAAAVDKNAICSSLFDGLESVADTVFSKSMPYCDVDVNSYEFDKASAAAELDAAGWIDTDGDGIREKDGVRLSGDMMYYSGMAVLDELALAIAGQLKEIGVEVKPAAMEMMAAYAAGMEGNFGIMLSQGYGITYDPYTSITNMAPSLPMDPFANKAILGIPDADALIQTLNSTPDEQIVIDTYNQILNEVNDSATIIPISFMKQLAVYNSDKIAQFDFSGQPGNIDVTLIKGK